MTIRRSKYASKITREAVAAIRSAPLSVTHADLARRYGVSATTVARIRRGLTWPEERPQEVRVRVPAEAVAGLEEAARRAGTTPAGLLADTAVQLAADERREEPGAGG